jgi:hypothetical protein
VGELLGDLMNRGPDFTQPRLLSGGRLRSVEDRFQGPKIAVARHLAKVLCRGKEGREPSIKLTAADGYSHSSHSASFFSQVIPPLASIFQAAPVHSSPDPSGPWEGDPSRFVAYVRCNAAPDGGCQTPR